MYLGTWEPERSTRFSVHLLLPGMLCLHDMILEHIVEKEDFGEILLVPPQSWWNDSLDRIAKKNNILLVPMDEVFCLKDGRISATPQWGEYLQAFSRMVDVALPSRYHKAVCDYVFARRNGVWFLQFGETTSTLDLELLGPLFIQHLLKFPDHRFMFVNFGVKSWEVV